METIFKELPTVIPFYNIQGNQLRYRENIKNIDLYRNVSTSGARSPFIIQLPANTPAPIKWEIVQLDGFVIDLSANIPTALIADNYDDFTYCYYRGANLAMSQAPTGYWWHRITFPGGLVMHSEVLFTTCNNNLLQIDFWNDEGDGKSDIGPIRYRNNFLQRIYLDTFIHDCEPEIEEEGERDGNNNLIPTFVKMTFKYKAEATVPEYIKNALTSIQLHNRVYVLWGFRGGYVQKIVVTSQTDETGAYSSCILDIYMDSIETGNCNSQKPALTPNYWA